MTTHYYIEYIKVDGCFQVGGSTITLMTMVLPAIFYLYLIAGEAKRKDLIKRGLMKREDPDDVRASLYE